MKLTSFKEAWSIWRSAGIDSTEATYRLRSFLSKIGIKSASNYTISYDIKPIHVLGKFEVEDFE